MLYTRNHHNSFSRSISLFKSCPNNCTVFADRGIPDLIAYTKCFGLPTGPEQKAAKIFRYSPKVFFAPAWKEIYTNDQERQISFEEAKKFENDLKIAYTQLGYELIELPFSSVEKRVHFIETTIYQGTQYD